MEWHPYQYAAHVISVYDGDTCRVDIDLGFHTWIHNERIRLARIDTPELRGAEREAGLMARDYLRKLVLDCDVRIETNRDRQGKYGRFLAEMWVARPDGSYLHVNEDLVAAGHAVYLDE